MYSTQLHKTTLSYLKSFLPFCCLLLLSLSLSAQTFDLTPNCEKAYKAIMDLRLADARQWIEIESIEHPNNLFPLYLDNIADCVIIYLEEREEDLRSYEVASQKRIERIEAEGDPNSPYYLFCLAEIKLQSALSRIKFEEYFTAAWEVRKGFLMLQTNQKKFPDFYPNYKSLGYLHAFIGTVPDSYKWILGILGMTGDIEQGMNEVNLFLENTPKDAILYKEAQLVHCFFLIFLDTKYDQALQIITQEINPETSLLDTFIACNIAYRLGKPEFGIQVLENRPKSNAYYDLPLLEYMLGIMKFYRQDKDADVHLKNFLETFEGRHYIKDAYQKLSWFYLIQGDTDSYRHYIKKCLTEGYTFVDNDKKAKEEAESNELPNVDLLKARVLFDGGYFQKSLEITESIDAETLQTEAERIETIYRISRAYEGIKDWNKAIENFKKTISLAGVTPLYFAPKSALQLGIIYERQQQKTLAIQYYKKALSYKKHAYKNSLDQQAKAGLNRLKQK